MNHNFQIVHMNVPVNRSSQWIMFCSKCGLSYEYTGHVWDMIPFKPSEKPSVCHDGPLLMDDETIKRLGGTIPEE